MNHLWGYPRLLKIPICSMYGIFTYIWLIFRANVGKYSIHGAYGIANSSRKKFHMNFHRKFPTSSSTQTKTRPSWSSKGSLKPCEMVSTSTCATTWFPSPWPWSSNKHRRMSQVNKEQRVNKDRFIDLQKCHIIKHIE